MDEVSAANHNDDDNDDNNNNDNYNSDDAPAFLYRPGSCVPKDVTRVRIHRSVTAIPDGAFAGNARLVEVVLHPDVERVGRRAFCDCKSLTKINLVDATGLQVIGAMAFQRCSSLRSIMMPLSLEVVECQSFGGCKSLRKVRLNDGLRIIEGGAFMGCKSLRRIDIPSSVITMGKDAFRDCQFVGGR